MHTASALWYVAPRKADIVACPLAPPEKGEALLRTRYSGLSRGTERLVYSGLVPTDEHARMRAPLQEGNFPFPVKYGYCAVADVLEGPDAWQGKMVFVLHPHQTIFVAPLRYLHPLPAYIPPKRAVLIPFMETALNAVWDSGCGPGDRIAVVGGGGIGLAIAALAARIPGTEIVVVDTNHNRKPVCASLAVGFAAPQEIADWADTVFHCSATQNGLATAIRAAGDEATIVETSWYGTNDVLAPLGGKFHSQRLRLIGSQVGRLPNDRRQRWTHTRRLQTAIALLNDARLDCLITNDIDFFDLPAALPTLLGADAPGIVTRISYP